MKRYNLYTEQKEILEGCIEILEKDIKLTPPRINQDPETYNQNQKNWVAVHSVEIGLVSIWKVLDRQDKAKEAPHVSEL